MDLTLASLAVNQPSATPGGPTTQDVALNSQADILSSQFQNSTYMAMNLCNKNSPLKVVQLETRFLQVVENKNPQFLIQNEAAGTQQLIFGSVLAMQGAYAFYGRSAGASDSASMVDQFGANVRAVQGFSNLCNFTPVVITVIQMISADQSQVSQSWNYGDVSYDANVNTIVLNTNSTFTRFDTNTGLVKVGGLWPVGPQSFLSVNSLNNIDMTITMTLGPTASVRTFRQIM